MKQNATFTEESVIVTVRCINEGTSRKYSNSSQL